MGCVMFFGLSLLLDFPSLDIAPCGLVFTLADSNVDYTECFFTLPESLESSF